MINECSKSVQTAVTHRPEMTHRDGQSNGERSWSTDASQRVTRGEHGQHQHEWDDQLDDEGLCLCDSSTWNGSSKRLVCAAHRHRFEHCRSDDCSQRLQHDVEHRAAAFNTFTHAQQQAPTPSWQWGHWPLYYWGESGVSSQCIFCIAYAIIMNAKNICLKCKCNALNTLSQCLLLVIKYNFITVIS